MKRIVTPLIAQNLVGFLAGVTVDGYPRRAAAIAAPTLLTQGSDTVSLRAYLELEGYSRYFVDHYMIPMGAAIWSSRNNRNSPGSCSSRSNAGVIPRALYACGSIIYATARVDSRSGSWGMYKCC
jgi:hypothetical protein